MFEKELCPMCDKGRLKKCLDEFEPGFRVDAFKCDKCGECVYSEEVAEKIQAWKRAHAEKRHLVRVGNSLAAIIPAGFVKKLRLKEKQSFFVELCGKEIRINPAKG